jgi:hypothetical protein
MLSIMGFNGLVTALSLCFVLLLFPHIWLVVFLYDSLYDSLITYMHSLSWYLEEKHLGHLRLLNRQFMPWNFQIQNRYLHSNVIIYAICRSTRRKEVIIYDLLSFECYLYEHLELIIIFCTLLQKKIFKTIYFSKYYHCSSFPNCGDLQIWKSRWLREE